MRVARLNIIGSLSPIFTRTLLSPVFNCFQSDLSLSFAFQRKRNCLVPEKKTFQPHPHFGYYFFKRTRQFQRYFAGGERLGLAPNCSHSGNYSQTRLFLSPIKELSVYYTIFLLAGTGRFIRGFRTVWQTSNV